MRFLPIFLLVALLGAQPAARVQTGYDSIQASHLKGRSDVSFFRCARRPPLAAAGLRGRDPVDRQRVCQSRAQAAVGRLVPAAGSPHRIHIPTAASPRSRSPATDASETFSAPDATAIFPNDVSGAGAVVFAGFGITAPELNYDDYAGIDAKGKIVLIFNHEPQEADANSVFNGIGNTRYTNNNYKLFNAQRHGAIAVLTMPDPESSGTRARRCARQASVAQGRGPPTGCRRPRIPSEALSEGGPAIPLFTISARVADSLFEAAGKKAADVQSAIDSKPPRPLSISPAPAIELHTATAERRRANSYNVAGLIEGSDPALKAETIVFSGHFDHDGAGPAGIYHGADDNGSGTVGVVALAHAFAANPVKPRRSLLFIVFAAEERGLLGSYYYVSHPLRPLATTRAQINFDMIGRNETADPRVITEISPDTSNQLGLIGTHYSPDYRETVERQNKIAGLNLTYKWDLDSYNGILFRSDQYPFLLHDIPAIWWFTGFHPDYHQVTDTVEKINFEKMAKILKLAYLSGFEFADEAEHAEAAAASESAVIVQVAYENRDCDLYRDPAAVHGCAHGRLARTTAVQPPARQRSGGFEPGAQVHLRSDDRTHAASSAVRSEPQQLPRSDCRTRPPRLARTAGLARQAPAGCGGGREFRNVFLGRCQSI